MTVAVVDILGPSIREALVAAQAREKANRELRERYAQEGRDREIAALRLQATQHQAWQRNVDRAANVAAHQQRTRMLMGELDKMLSPPPPEPEREIVYVEAEEEWPVVHRWFTR